MPISIPNRVVVFDYGEVISHSPSRSDRDALVAVASADAAAFDEPAFWAAYWRGREALDEGTLTITDYWKAIATELNTSFSDPKIHQLWVTDFRGWLSADPGTLEVLADLRAGGTRMALLSNAGRDFGSYFRYSPLGELFEQVFVSGELGLIKPDARIFEHAMTELAITPAETVFIDNRDDNVRGAQALGIAGHVFTGADPLREFLSGLAAESATATR